MIRLYTIIVLLGGLLCVAPNITAQRMQNQRTISLEAFLDLATELSVERKSFQNAFNNSLRELENLQREANPTLSLSGTLPNFDRAVDAITQPDGTDIFLNRSLMNNNLDLRLEKRLLNSGGRIIVSSGLQRLDIFKTALNNNASTTYAINAFQLSIEQPIFGFNELKWDIKIARLKSEEARAKSAEINAQVHTRATELYVKLLDLQSRMENIQSNINTLDGLIASAKQKSRIGGTSKMDLLQLEIDRNKLRRDSTQMATDLILQNQLINTFLGTASTYVWRTVPLVADLPKLKIDEILLDDLVAQHPLLNSTNRLNRTMLEKDLDRELKSRGVQLSVDANLGVNQISNEFADVWMGQYLDQQRVAVEFSIPIYDWGKRKNEAGLIREQIDREQLVFQMEKNEFKNSALEIINKFQTARNNYNEITQDMNLYVEKYQTAIQQFKVGKIDAQLLSLALNDLVAIQLERSQLLIQVWEHYYKIKQLFFYQNHKIIEKN